MMYDAIAAAPPPSAAFSSERLVSVGMPVLRRARSRAALIFPSLGINGPSGSLVG